MVVLQVEQDERDGHELAKKSVIVMILTQLAANMLSHSKIGPVLSSRYLLFAKHSVLDSQVLFINDHIQVSFCSSAVLKVKGRLVITTRYFAGKVTRPAVSFTCDGHTHWATISIQRWSLGFSLYCWMISIGT